MKLLRFSCYSIFSDFIAYEGVGVIGLDMEEITGKQASQKEISRFF